VSERPEAARPGHRGYALIQNLRRELFNATTGLTNEVVVMRRRARRIAHAPDPTLDPVDPRQSPKGNKEVQGAEDGSPADAATR